MEFRTLGKTDLKVSRLCIGTMTFGSQVSEADAIRMMDRCLEHGINFVDTANVYNHGAAEIITGKSLKGRRHNVVVATKVRGKMGEQPDDAGLTRAAIRKAVDGSLKRLQTDFIDLYYMHQPDWNTPIQESLAAMDELVREGKVRYPAASNYSSWQICQMLWLSENHGYTPPTVTQPIYNLLARGIEQEYLAFCKEYGVAVVPYNPLAGGLLTGKHSAEAAPEAGTRFHDNQMYQDRYWHPVFFDAVEKLSAIAQREGMSLVEFAFRWLLAQPGVDSIILGATRMEQIDQNVKACQGPGPGDEVSKECDEIWNELRGLTPKYNR